MVAQWIPNVDVFFDSLVRVIHGARSHLSTDDIDSAVFWSRRLDEYGRTLTLLVSRVAESRPNQESTDVNYIHKRSQGRTRFSDLSKGI